MGGSQSRLSFTQSLNELFSIEDPGQLSEEYWQQFWSAPTSIEDIYSFMSANDIRKLRDKSSKNYLYFIEKIVDRIKLYFFNENETATDKEIHHKKDNKEVLNCVRILTRILPYCFECPETNQKVTKLLAPSFSNTTDTGGWKGVTIAIIDLLFIPGLTLPIPLSEKSKIFYLIWESGIGSDSNIGSYQELDMNRQEIMRLLLVLMLWSIYQSSESNQMSPFAFTLTCLLPEPVVLALLCSLLNMIIKFDPIGWGIPYNYYLFPDYGESIVNTAVQLLSVLLDFDPTESLEASKDHWTGYILEALPSDKKIYNNSFRYYVSKLYRKEDFKLLLDGFIRLITNPIRATNTYLPSSAQQVKVYPELLTIFWRLMQFNASFYHYLIHSNSVLELLVALIYYSNDARFAQDSDGLVHLSCFIILHLTGDREFNVNCNLPFQSASFYTSKLSGFSGTYADFLILSYSQLMNSSKVYLYSIGECLLMTIVNMSPFIRGLSQASMSKLVELFEKVSSVNLIFPKTNQSSSVFYTKMTALLLEIFNYTLEYQHDNNAQAILVLYKNRKAFEALLKMTYESYTKTALEGKPSTEPTSPKLDPEELSESLEDRSSNTFLTEEEFNQVKSQLDFSTTSRLFENLSIELEQYSHSISGLPQQQDDRTVLNYLHSRTLVGLVPAPRGLSLRKFKMSKEIALWLSSYLLGIIYVHNINPPIWYGTDMKLFKIRQVDESDSADQ